MDINANEIATVLKEKIKNYKADFSPKRGWSRSRGWRRNSESYGASSYNG